MRRSGQVAALSEVADVIAAQRQSLAEAALEAMRAEIPGYAALANEALLADVVAHVTEAVDALSISLARGRPVTDDDVAFVRPHAARRARQGMPLVDFMHALRIAHRLMWETIADWAVHTAGGRDVALEAGGLVMELINRGSTVAARAYLTEEQFLAVEGDRVRRDLLEDLIAGREPTPGPRLTAATKAGLHPDTACAVVVAVPAGPVDDPYSLRSAASLLGQATGDPARALTVLRQDEIVIVRALRDGAGSVSGEPVKTAWRRLADRGTRLAVGISTRYDTVIDLGKAYHEAVSALGTLPPEGGVVCLSDLSVLDYLTLRADETAARIVPAALRTFVAEDSRADGTLIRTVEEYAASDLNVKAAAQRLGVHINTAHHRLARVEERTGCDMRRLTDLQQLLIAIKLLGRGSGR